MSDNERQHGLVDAIAEYDRFPDAYAKFGYETIILPKVSVRERAEFVMRHLC